MSTENCRNSLNQTLNIRAVTMTATMEKVMTGTTDTVSILTSSSVDSYPHFTTRKWKHRSLPPRLHRRYMTLGFRSRSFWGQSPTLSPLSPTLLPCWYHPPQDPHSLPVQGAHRTSSEPQSKPVRDMRAGTGSPLYNLSCIAPKVLAFYLVLPNLSLGQRKYTRSTTTCFHTIYELFSLHF